MSSPISPARLLELEKLRETVAGIRRGAASTHFGDPRYSCVVGADHLDQMTAAIPALLDEVARLRQLALGIEEQRHATALRNIELELALGEAAEKFDRLSVFAGSPPAVAHRDVTPDNTIRLLGPSYSIKPADATARDVALTMALQAFCDEHIARAVAAAMNAGYQRVALRVIGPGSLVQRLVVSAAGANSELARVWADTDMAPVPPAIRVGYMGIPIERPRPEDYGIGSVLS